MSKHFEVRILNPASGSGYTSGKRAKVFVACGRADWVEKDGTGNWVVTGKGSCAIRFRESDPRVQATLRCVQRRDQERCYDRAASTGMATLQQMRNVPIMNPIALLIKTRGKSRPTSWPLEPLNRSGVANGR